MSKKCCHNCKVCQHLIEEVADGYDGQESSSYQYCKLGLDINFLDTNMDTTENKVFAVYRQLNTLVGYEIPSESKPQLLCKKAGLSVVESKKVLSYLIAQGYLQKSGKAAGTKYKLLKKIDVETNAMVNGALSYRDQSFKKSKTFKESKVISEKREIKTYTIGQQVLTLNNNRVIVAVITKMSVKEGTPLDKINNSTIDYELTIDPATQVIRDVYHFSDSIDGLLSLIKLEYNKSF